MRILNTAVPGTRRLSVNMDILSDYVRMKSFAGELDIRNNDKMNIKTTLAPRVSWLGHRKRHIHRIGSGETVDIHLQAIFSEPGVYDLNRFQFTLLRGLNGTGRNTMFLFPYQYLISVSSANSKEEEESLMDFMSSKNEESSLIDLMSSSVVSTKEEDLTKEEDSTKEEDMLGIFCDDTSTSVVKTEDLFDGDAPSSSNDVLRNSNDTPSSSNDIFGEDLFDGDAPSSSNDILSNSNDTPSSNNDIFGDDSLFDREPSTNTDASALFDSGPPKEASLDIFDNAEDDKKEPVENGTSDDLDFLFSNEPVT